MVRIFFVFLMTECQCHSFLGKRVPTRIRLRIKNYVHDMRIYRT